MLEVFAELGMVFLLFWVGLESRISEIHEVGKAIVASIGAATAVPGPRAFAVIVGMSVITTLAVPPLLRRLAPAEAGTGTPAPDSSQAEIA